MGFRGLPAPRRAIAFLALPLLLFGSIPAMADTDPQGDDNTSPEVTSVNAPVTDFEGQGAFVEVPYVISDPSGLGWVTFEYVDPIGRYRYLTDAGLDGDVEQEVGPNWPTGIYTLERVMAQDGVGNTGSYYRDGRHFDRRKRSTHDVNLSLGDFRVVNDAADTTAATINSFELVSGPSHAPRDRIQIAYDIQDQSPIRNIDFIF
jgi:hypothetical protein